MRSGAGQVLATILAAISIAAALSSCRFEPEIQSARFVSCHDGDCVLGCSCLQALNVCLPDDPGLPPEQCSRCGDGVVDAEDGEQCDDGNWVLIDDCPDGPQGTCRDAACGDGFTKRLGQSPEQCDDGNDTDSDACSNACTASPSCGIDEDGDGRLLDPGEECDLGTANSDTAPGGCPGVCRTDCRCPRCGDCAIDFARGEECDDCNTASGDGCSASCAIEPGPSCGSGRLDLDQGEECDDGMHCEDLSTACLNDSDCAGIGRGSCGPRGGDGCSAACQYEPVGQRCGDDHPDPLEKCDDGNTANGDGCNPTCNLTTSVRTLASGLKGAALAVDDRYLWIGSCDTQSMPSLCAIQRIDLDACLQSGSCTPTTVAGGACGTAQDGQGSSAVMSCVRSITTDGASVWFGDSNTVRAMDTQSFEVATIAGRVGSCAAVDGAGTDAYFHDIRGLTYLDGQVYLLDGCENVLRRLDPSTCAVQTIAGDRNPDPNVTQNPPYTCPSTLGCIDPTPADGYGLKAVFRSPRYMTADRAGRLYIVDTNGESVRSYDIATGWLGTLVGGQGYQDGVGSAVRISRPRAICSDGSSIYFNEQYAHTVRQLVIQSLETSTLIGVRGCPGSRDGTGGDGSQDWSADCTLAPSTAAQIDSPLDGLAYHFPSRSLLLVEGGRLRQIE
ncbi:MAG: DUF4215 domain-containing protein [Deltaproteobacteria bacterium]|nr:DUF4215 domain-containing protein [Deltaproteobacteria bacterium]